MHVYIILFQQNAIIYNSVNGVTLVFCCDKSILYVELTDPSRSTISM